jgi:hypothetical protein
MATTRVVGAAAGVCGQLDEAAQPETEAEAATVTATATVTRTAIGEVRALITPS